MANITQPGQLYSLSQAAKLRLYQLDTTPIVDPGVPPVVLRWHYESRDPDLVINWRGLAYQCYPVTSSGFSASTAGSLPAPRLRASNVFGFLNTVIANYGGLTGAIVRRYTILSTNVDGAPGANSLDVLDEQQWLVNRYSKINSLEVELELVHPQLYYNIGIPKRRLASVLD
jgi:lambda family phage minor tail protein L